MGSLRKSYGDSDCTTDEGRGRSNSAVCPVGPLPPSSESLWRNLIPVFANLFSGTLLRQSLLHPASLARIQIVGATLYVFDDVFRLNLALEPPQGILQRLAFLQSNFCHNLLKPAKTAGILLPVVRASCCCSASCLKGFRTGILGILGCSFRLRLDDDVKGCTPFQSDRFAP